MSDSSSNQVAVPGNILEHLRKFQFNKKSLAVNDKDIVSNKGSSSDSQVVSKHQAPLKEDPSKEATSEDVGTNGSDSAFSPPGSPLFSSRRKAQPLVSDDDDTPPPPPRKASRKKKPKPILDEEGRSCEERKLMEVLAVFPDADILLVQDALCRANWNVKEAQAHLTQVHASESTNDCSNQKKRPLGDCNGLSKAVKRKRRHEVDDFDEGDESEDEDEGYRRRRVYNSDTDSDEELSDSDDLSGEKLKVFEFLSKAEIGELQQMQQCSKKKAELLVDIRPFDSWKHMVEKLRGKSGLGPDFINYAQNLIHSRDVVAGLMEKCSKIACKIEAAVAVGPTSVRSQPSILSSHLTLSDYQLVGLNWLLIMDSHQVNGILADEMGLGKTVQIIAFLSHLKENKKNIPGKPHVIVVPSSTLENWRNELERWCPSIKVVMYYGSPEDRRYQRLHWSKHGFEDTEVVLTTYSMFNTPEEKRKFRVTPFHYAVFDEAHMLKNMNSLRYESLVKINAPHRILLTGTPLQNNLLELISLLAFVMPKLFKGKMDDLKALFSKGGKPSKAENDDPLPDFEQTQICHAKQIMKPFVLRRLKTDVLRGLPKKTDEVMPCAMNKDQQIKYSELVDTFSKQAGKILQDEEQTEPSENGMTVYMKLRRLANHPLLLRYQYKDEILRDMAKRLQKDPSYKDTVFDYIFEDLCVMSDFELHQMCHDFKSCYGLRLAPELIVQSGKFSKLDNILENLQENGHRALVFSQFVMVLDILEEYLRIRGHKYTRLDGSTPVAIRQELIDDYNKNPSVFIFLLSTRAGGLGINLTSADTVIIHDVDPNPHNDKQAEDRCHRIGQTKPVRVIRLLSKGTIEENIFNLAQEKLQLEWEVSGKEENEQSEKKSVARLLKQHLGLDKKKSS